MTERNRFLLKQFAGEASNNGVFGSYEAGTPTVSDDPTAIQSLPAYETGWEDATTSGSKLPRLEEMQGLQKLFCQAIKELYSEGIPLWIAGETYYLNSLCVYFDEDNDFGLYKNITGNNGNNIPPVDTTNWVKLVVDGADKDLSNLSSTGKNIANWSTNVTNCITEIPQDIKLELNNGVLTLKAGSKVYVPNGFESDGVTRKFDEVIVENDVSVRWGYNDVRYFCYKNMDIDGENIEHIYSGSTAPSGLQWMWWYDTVNNIIKKTADGGSTWNSGWSFPFGEIQTGSGEISAINKVFNGFGYIGSTVFALPGVKGLIPDERNTDGGLKSIEFTVNSVLTKTLSGTVNNKQVVCKSNDIGTSDITYDEVANINSLSSYCIIGNISISNDKITSFNTKTVFHAVDYNDREFIGHQAMPSDRYIDLTLGASGTSYTAPADGYLVLNKKATGVGQEIRLTNNSNGLKGYIISATNNAELGTMVSCLKGDVIYIYYSASGNIEEFRFIYIEGSK